MSDRNDSENWLGYYETTAGRPPRRTLVTALSAFPDDGARRFAVDLGCGDGRDTIELLRGGWSVFAIDAEPRALARLAGRDDLPLDANLRTLATRFEDAEWPACGLVNARFALPLCAPAYFRRLWRRILECLRPGGRFAGQLYGDRDSWARRPGLTHHARGVALGLLAGLEIELFEEEETDSVTPRGVGSIGISFTSSRGGTSRI